MVVCQHIHAFLKLLQMSLYADITDVWYSRYMELKDIKG